MTLRKAIFTKKDTRVHKYYVPAHKILFNNPVIPASFNIF